MGKIPAEMKLTFHAQQRLSERKDADMKYNTKNLMRSSVRWYGKDDLIHDCALYRHCCYTTRKSNQMGYITDGDIEVIYNKGTKTAITVLEVKDKFKPITQFIKPELLRRIELKKEKKKKMKDCVEEIKKEEPVCKDCGATGVKLLERGAHKGVCETCKRRIQNAKARGQEYIPYKDLPDDKKRRIDALKKAHNKQKELEKALNEDPTKNDISVPDSETYYQSKAIQAPVTTHMAITPTKIEPKPVLNPLKDQTSFITILKNTGCDIPEEILTDLLEVLISTDEIKSILTSLIKTDRRNVLTDFEQTLNITEKKLQQEWEANDFQEADDIKFKGFLVWRKTLKGAISFWKNLYNTNIVTELQKACDIRSPISKTQQPEKIKQYQITTETISTILNTRKSFTRVVKATSTEEAHKIFVEWLADRQLHEDPKKTTIVELNK